MRSLYSAVNRRRVGFAATSGSGIVAGTPSALGRPARRARELSTPPLLLAVTLPVLMPPLLSSPSYTDFRGVSVSEIIDKEGLDRLDHELRDAVKTWQLAPLVEALPALRGVELTGAIIRAADLGDITRFDRPRQLMSYLGLTPSEYSSGERRRQGGITKAGNGHARRALVEGAWAYRYPAKVSRHLQPRLEKLPAEIQAIARKAQVRLCCRYRQLTARGKHVA